LVIIAGSIHLVVKKALFFYVLIVWNLAFFNLDYKIAGHAFVVVSLCAKVKIEARIGNFSMKG